MSGIYIHIPFCKQACYYCDFHFSTLLKNKEAFLSALKKEIAMRKDYFNNDNLSKPALFSPDFKISTVYFGGGTPSLLSQKEIEDILVELGKYFSIDKNAEITLEANPDDLTKAKISELKSTPVNRLSIGIQSFSNEDLKWMNRAHNSKQAISSVQSSLDAGFENISIDLIYGIPTLSDEQWYKNLDTSFSLAVPHISAYCLTVEPKTALANFIRKGKRKSIDEEKAVRQFEILMDAMEKHHFIQYEISNFCKPCPSISAMENEKQIPREGIAPSFWGGWEGLHNSSYWEGKHYLGLGPSAHSYNGKSRQWNISNNNLYIKAIEKNELNFEKEILSDDEIYNEYILTSLRTIRGCNLQTVKKNFGEKRLKHALKNIEPYILSHDVLINNHILTLTKKGKFISDKIVRDMFA